MKTRFCEPPPITFNAPAGWDSYLDFGYTESSLVSTETEVLIEVRQWRVTSSEARSKLEESNLVHDWISGAAPELGPRCCQLPLKIGPQASVPVFTLLSYSWRALPVDDPNSGAKRRLGWAAAGL